jgi:hypothetical protein
MRKSVDFPAPLRPSSPIEVREGRVSVTSSTTVFETPLR